MNNIVEPDEMCKTNREEAVRSYDVGYDLPRVFTLGYNVIPTDENKKPRIKWQEDYKFGANRLPVTFFNQWTEKWGVKQWALLTGKKPYSDICGLVCVDADNAEAISIVEKYCPATPLTAESSRGRHYMYRRPDVDYVKSRNFTTIDGVEYKLDIKADGGIMILPGSVHKSGHVYKPSQTWTRELIESLPVYDPSWIPHEEGTSDTSESNSPNLDDDLLVDPDAGAETAFYEITLKDLSFESHEVQCNLLAHLVHGPESIMQVAAKVFEPKVFDAWWQKKTAEIVIEHFRQFGERPDKSLLCELLRQAGRNRKGVEEDVAAFQRLDSIPLTSVGFWTDAVVFVSQRYKIAMAQKQLKESGDLTEFYSAVQDAREMDTSFEDFELYRPSELSGEDIVWQIADHFPINGTVTVFGASGVGKSFFCLEQALCIAHGVPFLGKYETQAGRVLYLCSEGSHGLNRRLTAWQRKHGIKELDNILISTRCHNLQDRSTVERLIHKATEKMGGIDAVFIDTLSRNFGSGDTDKNADMQSYLRNVDFLREKTGATVINIHHTGWNDVGRERGAKSLRDYADSSICIEAEGTQLKVSCKKQKDAAPFETYFLDKVANGTSMSLEIATAGAAEPLADQLLDQIPVLALSAVPAMENTVSSKLLAEKVGMSAKTVNNKLTQLKKEGAVQCSRFGLDSRFPFHYWRVSDSL